MTLTADALDCLAAWSAHDVACSEVPLATSAPCALLPGWREPDLSCDDVRRLARQLARVGLVARAACIVAGGLGDGSKQAFREEHAHALRVAKGQDIDELRTCKLFQRSPQTPLYSYIYCSRPFHVSKSETPSIRCCSATANTCTLLSREAFTYYQGCHASECITSCTVRVLL